MTVQIGANDFCQKYWSLSPTFDYVPSADEIAQYKQDSQSGKGCSSEDLLLGSYPSRDSDNGYIAADPTAARRCAILRSRAEYLFGSNFFEDYGMLSLLYAAGNGVPQSWPMAAHFACIGAFWGGDDNNRPDRPKTLPPRAQVFGGLGVILAVENAMRSGEPSEDYDGCDYPVENEQLNVRQVAPCLAFRQKRALTTAALMSFDRSAPDAKLSPNRSSLFNVVVQNDAMVLNAMNISIKDVRKNATIEKADYESLLKIVTSGIYPVGIGSDLTTEDNELNRLYQKSKATMSNNIDPSIWQAFQDAERSWIAYRDGLASEAESEPAGRTPQDAKTVVLIQLTKQRIAAFNRWIDMLQPSNAI